MTRPAILPFPVLILLVVVIAGCGSSATMNTASTRMMQGLTVTPSAADAQKFPNGQVQFVATGAFNMAPMSVMSPAVRWSIGNPFATPMPMAASMSTGQPSISGNGVAQCNGFIGMVTIEATAPADPNMGISQMSTMTRNVSGMATLICP